MNRREAEAQYLASQRNLAASFAEQGDRAWLERDIAGAEVAYARAVVTDDQRAWREKLIEVRARGIRRLRAAPNRLRADVVAYGTRAGELLVALRDRTIRTWDLEAKTNTEVWQGHKAPITALVGNKEGHIASGDANEDVWLWTRGIAQGSMLSPSHVGSVLDLAFLSDGAIASIGSDGILIIRDAADGTATLNVRLAGAPPDAAVILPDIGVVIVGDRKGRLRTHRLSDGEESSAFAAGSTAIGALAVSSDRTRIATWSAPAGNGQIAGITVWQRETGQLIARGPDDLGNPSTHGLSFSPDGEELAISQGSGGLLWRIGDPPKQHYRLPANDTMRCFLYLDNGNRLAAGGDALHLWALHPTNKEVDLPGHAKSPSAAAFSPDGKVIATTGFDGSLRLWDAAQGTSGIVFRGEDVLSSPVWNAAGTRIAVCNWANGVVILNSTSLAVERRFPVDGRIHDCVASDQSGSRLAVFETPNRIRFYDYQSLEPLGLIDNPDMPLATYALMPDGTSAAIIDNAGVVTIRSIAEQATVALAPHLGSGRPHIAVSPNGRIIAASAGRQVLIWDLSMPEAPRHTLDATANIQSLRFSPDGQRLIAASTDIALVWDVVTGARVAEIRPREIGGGYLTDVAIDRDGRRLAVLGEDIGLEVWSLEDGPVARTLRQPERQPGETSIFTPEAAFSTDGETLALTTAAGAIRLIATQDAGLLDLINVGDIGVTSLAFEPGAASPLFGTANGDVQRWVIGQYGFESLAGPFPAYIAELTVSPDGRWLAFATAANAGEETRTVFLQSLQEGGPPEPVVTHGRVVEALSFTPDSKALLSGSMDMTAQRTNIDPPKTDGEFLGHTGTVTDISSSPDGRWIVTASRDGLLRLFGSSDRHLEAVRKAHPAFSQWVEAAAVTPDGKLVASSGYDGTVRLWSLPDLEPVIALRRHEGAWVQRAVIDPTGRFLLSGADDPWTVLWNIPEIERILGAQPAELLSETLAATGRAAGSVPARTSFWDRLRQLWP